MKIKERTAYLDWDDRNYLEIVVDGRVEVSFCDGEKEDNSLGRNFNDCYSITDLMVKAYKAGLEQEEFEFTQEKVDWEEI